MFEPLLSDARTGFAHYGCYANVTADCSMEISKEHWLSANILREAGDQKPLRVSGMPWQGGKEHLLSDRNMGANVLCSRHNRALSPLDRTVGHLFAILRHFQRDLPANPEPHGHEFALYTGEHLSRWMLKLLWGGAASKAFGRVGQPVETLRSDADLNVLADYLFRDGSLPNGWGLYVEGIPGQQVSAEAEVAIDSVTGPNNTLWGCSVEFGVIRLNFNLGTPDPTPGGELVQNPQGVFMADLDLTAQKILALGWDGASSNPVTYTFLRRAE